MALPPEPPASSHSPPAAACRSGIPARLTLPGLERVRSDAGLWREPTQRRTPQVSGLSRHCGALSRLNKERNCGPA